MIILFLMVILFVTINFNLSYGITNLDKPANPYAYSFGTTISIKWTYSVTPGYLGSYFFEIDEYIGGVWIKINEVKYPVVEISLPGQTVGRHIYRLRTRWEYLVLKDYSSYTNNLYAYVLAKPTGLKVEHLSNKYDLKISWDVMDSNADKIEVYRRDMSFTPPLHVKIAVLDKSATSYVDSSVLPNKSYRYSLALRKFDETEIKDDWSERTSDIQLTTFPKGVDSLSGSGQGDTVYLTWSYTNYPTDTTISGFKVYEVIKTTAPPPLPPIPITLYDLKYTLPNTTFNKIISGVTYGSHIYQVRTYNSAGESFENINLTVYAFKTPTNLTATPLSSNSIKLNWDPVDSNATSIVISRSVDGSLYTGLTSISSTNTSYIDTTCSPNTQYWYKIKAKRDLNESSFSNSASAKTSPLGSPPASPTNLEGTAINCNQIDITWQDNATDETNYIVERKIEGGTFSVKATLPANTTIYSDTSVSPNTKYYYRVKAKNSFGDSGYSNEISVTTPSCGTPPNAPTNLTLNVISSSQINLSWSDNSDNEDGFKVERKVEGGSYSLIATLGANITSYNDTSLSPNTKYYYKIIAFNSFGQSSSNEASATTFPLGTPPTAPSNLTANALSCNQVQLNWVDNSDNENGFRIERKESGGSYSVLVTLGSDVTSYLDETVNENKNYTYKVIAFNDYGENSSIEKSVLTPFCGTKPSTPTDLTLTVLSPNQIRVSFTDNSDNEDGFKVERKELGGVYSEIKTLSANITEFIDNVNPNTTYYYRVRAFNTHGYSDFSDEANATTPQVGVPPNSPTNLIASASSCNEVLLIWIDNSNNEDGFKIERKEEGGSYILITTLTSNTTLFNDTTTSGNKKYYYRVYAFNSYGVSNFSNESIVTTPPCGNKPNAPSNLFGEASSKSEISLSWKDNSDNEDGFILERKEEGGSYNVVTTLPKDTNKYSDKNLLPDKTYYYRIKAFNSFGESDYSNELKIKTPKDIELIILRFYIGKTIYYQNDEMKNMDVAPMIFEGRTLLPIRYVAEALGANVGWEAKEQKVTINFKGIIIELWIGKNLATVNGEWKLIDPSNPNVKP
ncbi:MAG: fibronectin type III domain-containing protein, partial [Caldisericia bacterium]|nr:fibronectin type III domain-containing protein [Caldisericia bacterium]